MADLDVDVTVLDVLGVDICRRAILDYVNIKDIIRSERVSRRWRQMVLGYLESCRSLQMHCWDDDDLHFFSDHPPGCPDPPVYASDHRSISFNSKQSSLQIICKLVEEIGVAVGWFCDYSKNQHDEVLYKVVGSCCPNLRYVELWDINVMLNTSPRMPKPTESVQVNNKKKKVVPEEVLSNFFRNKELKQVRLYQCYGVTGNCLSSMKYNKLIKIKICSCRCLVDFHAIGLLKNVTCLEFDDNGVDSLTNVHILLKQMPKVERISLCNYKPEDSLDELNNKPIKLSDEFIECFSQLGNLKWLDMTNNAYINNDLLKALARGSSKLNYLSISYFEYDSPHEMMVPGLTALIFRKPDAVTTLWYTFGYSISTRSLHLQREVMPLMTAVQERRKLVATSRSMDGFRTLVLRLDPLSSKTNLSNSDNGLKIIK